MRRPATERRSRIETNQSRPELAKQKILITGASGFLGSHLCRVLAEMGSEVDAVSRKRRGKAPGVRWWQGDLADFTVTRELLRRIKPDLIFHLTTHGWGGAGLEHVRPTLESDLVATVNLLAVATELNTRRVVLTGSAEEPQSGGSEIAPASPYAAAKWACSGYARMFHRLYGTRLVMVRLSMAYGPGQPPKKLIPYTVLSLLRGEPPIIAQGQRLIDWVYVEDVIQGILTVASADGVEGSTLDLGSGSLVSVAAVVKRIVQMTGVDLEPIFKPVGSNAVEPMRAADVARLETLGWKAATPLDEGLKLTIDWYRAHSTGAYGKPKIGSR